MSDSQTQSYTPAIVKPARKTSMIVWVVVLLVAVAAFAAAVVWAGGPSTVEQLLGGIKFPALFGAPTPTPSGSAGVPVSAAPSSTLPAAAQRRMYAEQVESAAALTDLVNGQITSLELSAPQQGSPLTTIPVKAIYADGHTVSGFLSLEKYNGLWYFFSIGRSPSATDTDPPHLASLDSSVVAAITAQQALPATQEMIASGLLTPGSKTLTIGTITPGPRTATVDAALQTGTAKPVAGRFVLISKTDGATTYWFVARFEKR